MRSRIGIVLFGCIAVLAACFGFYNFYTQPRIAYVRSSDLVNNYLGMKEGMRELDSKKQVWRSNIDTLTLNLQRSVHKFNRESDGMSSAKKVEMEKYLSSQQEELIKYTNAVEQKAEDENELVMKGILNQINSYVEEYGQSHGYDIILGTTLSGNVLYGKKYLDITDDVLKGLNEHFQGKKRN